MYGGLRNSLHRLKKKKRIKGGKNIRLANHEYVGILEQREKSYSTDGLLTILHSLKIDTFLKRRWRILTAVVGKSRQEVRLIFPTFENDFRLGSDAVLQPYRIKFNELSSCEVRRLNKFGTAELDRLGQLIQPDSAGKNGCRPALIQTPCFT